MRVFIASVLMLVLAACSQRGDFISVAQLAPEKAALAATTGTREAIFVGTSRMPDEQGGWGFGRAEAAHFLRYDVHVPSQRKLGEVTWPKSVKAADPATDFLTLGASRYQKPADFRRDLNKALRQRGQNDVVVYVHGYNNTMAESVYRVAQMHHDLKISGVAVHYAWPSRGSALGYVYDRDSALFGRDGMEELLMEVVQSGAKRIVIVAHSMGSVVAMETLRQAAIRTENRVQNAIGGVILISPDLDVDLFRSQAMAMGKLPQPFMIFGSSKDTVLGISSKLSGASDRLGNLKDLGQLANLDVTYLDTAAYSQGAGHFNVGTSPALIQLLGGIGTVDASFRAEAAARVGLLPGAVLTVRNATAVVLAPVERVAIRD